ncbi:MAG: hypothetical protein U0992_15655 [Planctomycetaceae bacterium]
MRRLESVARYGATLCRSGMLIGVAAGGLAKCTTGGGDLRVIAAQGDDSAEATARRGVADAAGMEAGLSAD